MSRIIFSIFFTKKKLSSLAVSGESQILLYFVTQPVISIV